MTRVALHTKICVRALSSDVVCPLVRVDLLPARPDHSASLVCIPQNTHAPHICGRFHLNLSAGRYVVQHVSDIQLTLLSRESLVSGMFPNLLGAPEFCQNLKRHFAAEFGQYSNGTSASPSCVDTFFCKHTKENGLLEGEQILRTERPEPLVVVGRRWRWHNRNGQVSRVGQPVGGESNSEEELERRDK